ncbi:DUF3868 domain-containing protein [Bacteroides sp. 519]|uniref:DUF3868 domain-containing protein n=1 Tax=Bacteroides sp. 519 TaxID=2302937 RepID=UPI0013D852C3|nr:DUF3868 domain-containing protein [Bacteroides sp. 519]NDV60441.1 DUF3868 domain-containing protein [Bacteroides sp. 519]
MKIVYKNKDYKMRNNFISSMSFITFMTFFITFSFPVSAQDYKGDVLVESTHFREHNDSLIVGFNIRVEANAVPTCSSMTFTPELRGNKNLVELPYIQVNGKKRKDINQRWFAVASRKWLSEYEPPQILVNADKYVDEHITYYITLPYESWMDKASLYLRQELIGCRDQVNLYTYKLDSRVEMAVREPYKMELIAALVAPADEVKTRNRQGSAFLDFQVGRSVILPDFRRNPVELGKINDALVEVMGNMDSQITGLFIEGYASPEGRYASNESLSRDRATALKDYIRNRYMLSDNIFTVRWVPEDWVGLKAAVQGSNLPQKDLILRIIDNGSDYDAKEQQLKGLSSYGQLLRDIFPELRRVEYQIDYKVRNYTTAEARSLMNTNPENLSQAELYRVAVEYGKDTPEYNRILMEIIPKYYENDPVAMNNAAALLIQNSEENTALRMLEKAPNLPAAWNNKGVVYMLRGELDKAEELLKQASVAGIQEATHNLKELQTKREDELKRTNRGR